VVGFWRGCLGQGVFQIGFTFVVLPFRCQLTRVVCVCVFECLSMLQRGHFVVCTSAVQ